MIPAPTPAPAAYRAPPESNRFSTPRPPSSAATASHVRRVAEIATTAGVSKPLVLNYFGSKEHLFAACVERTGTHLADRIDDAARIPSKTVSETINLTLTAIFTALSPRRYDWAIINESALPAGVADDAARKVRRRIADQAFAGVAVAATGSSLTDPDDVGIATDLWMGIVSAAVGWWLRHPDRDADEMITRTERVVHAFLGT